MIHNVIVQVHNIVYDVGVKCCVPDSLGGLAVAT